ncbi:hypothetical protein CS022_14370 [Veronia nyctiphanis]|uniref:DUF484 domain-containing protein n=1 Tax=Veronia nyctiphanis TaxID=1278244 RepID=A0A4Q0YTX5_9GAMM|nr:DUF484 family protein [Veronia nyctiphanis]RXJ72629.1 hypothetical protein CS022_14370 [Veronia nyctiphanis]
MTDISRIDTPETVTKEDVIRYLEDNPEFFRRFPELLLQLKVNHEERGAVSLVEAQMSRLRSRVNDLEEEITQLMGIAAGNEQLFRAFSLAHQRLFAVESSSEIRHALDELAESLKLTVSLRLYSDSDAADLDKSRVDTIRAARFSGQRHYLGRLRRSEGDVFVKDAPELGSYAIVPVSQAKDFGFLTFASHDGGHFQPSMDTLFVEQLAEHLAVILSRWQGEA